MRYGGDLTWGEVFLRSCQDGRLDLRHALTNSVLPAPLPAFPVRFLPFYEYARLSCFQGPRQLFPEWGSLHHLARETTTYAESHERAPPDNRSIPHLPIVFFSVFLHPVMSSRVSSPPFAITLLCTRKIYPMLHTVCVVSPALLKTVVYPTSSGCE